MAGVYQESPKGKALPAKGLPAVRQNWDLIDGMCATGAYVFNGGQSPSPPGSPSPASDSQNDNIDPALMQDDHYDPLPDPASKDDDKPTTQTSIKPQDGWKRRRSTAGTLSKGEPKKGRRTSAGKGMTSIATSKDKAAESLAEAMTGVAKTLMQPQAVSPGLLANAATKDACMTTVMNAHCLYATGVEQG
ncbi:hypothetical protein EI94DRAFT_1818110 [Lactarius quietus]|nr:hypothetical protein EI94DRAFT_1818110 [Lactarius quietus]